MTISFRPDIEFGTLLDNRQWSQQELTAIFGRSPTKGDIDHLRKMFKGKHPELYPQLACSRQHGVRLMSEQEASVTNAQYAISASKASLEHTRKLFTQRTGQLTAQEKRDHETRALGVIDSNISQLTAARKALPAPNGGSK